MMALYSHDSYVHIVTLSSPRMLKSNLAYLLELSVKSHD
jgi:hypothetical protein